MFLLLQQQTDWLSPQGAIGFALMAIATLLAVFIRNIAQGIWGDVQAADAPAASSAYDIGARALSLAESADARATRAEERAMQAKEELRVSIKELRDEYEAKIAELEELHAKEREQWNKERHALTMRMSDLQNEVERLRLQLKSREHELAKYKEGESND